MYCGQDLSDFLKYIVAVGRAGGWRWLMEGQVVVVGGGEPAGGWRRLMERRVDTSPVSDHVAFFFVFVCVTCGAEAWQLLPLPGRTPWWHTK